MTAIGCVTYFVFASPMLVLFCMTCFKIDQVVARPRLARRRPNPRVNEDGFQMCMEPDGRVCRLRSRPR